MNMFLPHRWLRGVSQILDEWMDCEKIRKSLFVDVGKCHARKPGKKLTWFVATEKSVWPGGDHHCLTPWCGPPLQTAFSLRILWGNVKFSSWTTLVIRFFLMSSWLSTRSPLRSCGATGASLQINWSLEMICAPYATWPDAYRHFELIVKTAPVPVRRTTEDLSCKTSTDMKFSSRSSGVAPEVFTSCKKARVRKRPMKVVWPSESEEKKRRRRSSGPRGRRRIFIASERNKKGSSPRFYCRVSVSSILSTTTIYTIPSELCSDDSTK